MKQCSAIPLNVKGIISEPCRSENAHEYKTFSTMNRYRTTPGLGPSKASATTTCQKCLGKGHYSYECKASLQSRPYTSRASRTQQLRNPKLKPMLAETKMSEPVADGVGDVRNAETSASDEAKGRSRSLRNVLPNEHEDRFQRLRYHLYPQSQQRHRSQTTVMHGSAHHIHAIFGSGIRDQDQGHRCVNVVSHQ